MWNKLFYLLHSRKHGVTWLNSQWWFLRYRYRYHKYVIKIAKTFGEWASSVQRTAPGKDTELIVTLKMETRHLVGGPLCREFSAFVIVAELWRPEVARPGNLLSNFCIFLEKQPLMVKLSKRCRVTSWLDVYVQAKFHWNLRNFLLTHGPLRTDGRTDGHLRLALLGRLCERPRFEAHIGRCVLVYFLFIINNLK